MGISLQEAVRKNERISNKESTDLRRAKGIYHCHDNSRAYEERQREQCQAKRRLSIALVVCLALMIGEIAGGYFAGSLAVMTDAAHLLVDFSNFLISLFSLWLTSKPSTKKLTFGWYRAEILGALLSVISIWVVTGVLVYMACQRLVRSDYDINGVAMLITSGCAVLANVVLGFTLYENNHGHSHGHINNHVASSAEPGPHQRSNATVRAAFVHVVGDLLQSISVLISALIVFFKPEYKIADPICTFIFSVFVLATTTTILQDILLTLMEGTPNGISYNTMKERIISVDGVIAIHSLNVWALTINQAVLTVHAVIADTVDSQRVLKEITQAFSEKYNFYSVTIQLEQQSDQKPECIFCQEPRQ
ncbi:zinc transporter 8 [Protopterus annectens]|uniref:zinc transporter 8 n=1 Tax=Protopterus annectens TaxID=7888 RepID=UPI001CFB5D9D|nr:zinc transporter 8 [Protopterus annectens]